LMVWLAAYVVSRYAGAEGGVIVRLLKRLAPEKLIEGVVAGAPVNDTLLNDWPPPWNVMLPGLVQLN